MLAALSVQFPDTVAFGASGPLYCTGDAHASRPERESAPEKLMVTAWLYHPFESGPRSAFASALGAVASYLRSKVALPVFPALSEQLPLTRAPLESGPV